MVDIYKQKNVFDKPTHSGLFEMPFQSYLNLKLCDYSFLKEFAVTPAHGIAFLNQKKQISPTLKASFDFGSAAHMMLFEPERIEKEIITDLDKNKNSKEYKEWRSQIPCNAIVLKQNKIDDLRRMRDIVSAKTFMSEIVNSEGMTELTGIFQNEKTHDVWHKIRIDKLLTDESIIIDYKTSGGRIDKWAWEQARRRYKYDWQAALYCQGMTQITGINHRKFAWIVQESVPPFECRIIAADPADMFEAMGYIDECVENLAECMKTDHFPGYPAPMSWEQVFEENLYEIDRFNINDMEDNLSWM